MPVLLSRGGIAGMEGVMWRFFGHKYSKYSRRFSRGEAVTIFSSVLVFCCFVHVQMDECYILIICHSLYIVRYKLQRGKVIIGKRG